MGLSFFRVNVTATCGSDHFKLTMTATNGSDLFQVERDSEALCELLSELRVKLQDLAEVDDVDLVDVAVGQSAYRVHGLAQHRVRFVADVVLPEDVVLACHT